MDKDTMNVYADVGRSATTIALRLGRFADGERLKSDRLALCAARDELRRMSRGEVRTDPDENDPIFTTMEGQAVVVFAVREESSSSKKVFVMERLAARADMLDRVLTEESPEGVAEAKILDDFFLRIQQLADEISVIGLKANPVFEVFGALHSGGK